MFSLETSAHLPMRGSNVTNRVERFVSRLNRFVLYRHLLRQLGLSSRLAWANSYRRALNTTQLNMLPAHSIPQIKTVVDVGANVGNWSIGIAQLTPASRIIAFEPAPETYARLVQNVQRYPIIAPRHAALGAEVGTVDFFVESASEMSSLLRLRNSNSTQKIRVPMTTLDTELADVDEVSLLKIDVQGFESAVLAGGKEVLQRTTMLVIEVLYYSYYEGDTLFPELVYHIVQTSRLKLWGITAPHCLPSGQPAWADAVFVRQQH